jgi:hypothetical protein
MNHDMRKFFGLTLKEKLPRAVKHLHSSLNFHTMPEQADLRVIVRGRHDLELPLPGFRFIPRAVVQSLSTPTRNRSTWRPSCLQ